MRLTLINLKTLYLIKIIRHRMRRIQSKKYKLGTYEINKISLWCLDDKRFVLNDEIHTLAHFHKDLRKLILTFLTYDHE